jgi:hypothetical protein
MNIFLSSVKPLKFNDLKIVVLNNKDKKKKLLTNF